MAALRHISLNLLKMETSSKRGIKTKRLKVGWSDAHLLKVLQAGFHYDALAPALFHCVLA